MSYLLLNQVGIARREDKDQGQDKCYKPCQQCWTTTTGRRHQHPSRFFHQWVEEREGKEKAPRVRVTQRSLQKAGPALSVWDLMAWLGGTSRTRRCAISADKATKLALAKRCGSTGGRPTRRMTTTVNTPRRTGEYGKEAKDKAKKGKERAREKENPTKAKVMDQQGAGHLSKGTVVRARRRTRSGKSSLLGRGSRRSRQKSLIGQGECWHGKAA